MSLPRLTSFVKALLIALFASYVVQLILENWQHVPVGAWLALSPRGLLPWQLLTYVLVDSSNPLLFLFGLLVLWWVLAPFEIGFGARRTLQLCLCCVLGAALPAWLFGAAIAGSPPLYGTGPLWLGGLAASTYLYRDRPMSLFGVATLTARQFLLLIVGLSFLMFLASKNHTHFIGDLGGMAGGIGFVHYLRRPRSRNRPRHKMRGGAPDFRVIKGGSERESGGKTWLN